MAIWSPGGFLEYILWEMEANPFFSPLTVYYFYHEQTDNKPCFLKVSKVYVAYIQKTYWQQMKKLLSSVDSNEGWVICCIFKSSSIRENISQSYKGTNEQINMEK